MGLMLQKLTENYTKAFKSDMKAAFRFGALEGMGFDEDVLPEKSIDESLRAAGSAAYMVMLDEEMVGGAVIVIDPETLRGRLDFLYVKVGCQGKHVGQFIWSEIEKLHPEVSVWETCTPWFDKRNIHFYINRCGFHAVEFYNKHHPDPHFPEEEEDDEGFSGMFRFEKKTK